MEDKDKQGEGGQGRTTPEGHSEEKGKHYRCHSAWDTRMLTLIYRSDTGAGNC